MKQLLSILTFATAVSALPMMACGVDVADDAETQSEDALTASDAKIEKELAAAVKGLTTDFMGTESDPTPWRVTHFSLARGETLTDAVMVKKLFPKLKGMDDYSEDGRHRGSQSETATSFWQSRTETPVRDNFDSDEDFAKAKQKKAGA